VLAGSGSNDTRHSVELTKAASDTGVDGILCVTPYYNRPSQDALYGHFSAVASATDLPVVLYDIPVRTGRASPRRRCCAWRATSPTSWPLRTQPVT